MRTEGWLPLSLPREVQRPHLRKSHMSDMGGMNTVSRQKGRKGAFQTKGTIVQEQGGERDHHRLKAEGKKR